jgi:hypothetical protein
MGTEIFSNMEIVVTLSRQLSWSHFVAILPLKDDLQRDFYAEMCRIERWSVRRAGWAGVGPPQVIDISNKMA